MREIHQDGKPYMGYEYLELPAGGSHTPLQLAGYDMDKNVITRIETNKRYVSDLELKAFAEIFHVSYVYLIDGEEE